MCIRDSRITLEYIVFNNFNDTLQDAKELWEFTKRVPSRVNIIEYNPITESDFQNTEADKLDKFAAYLEDRGVTVSVRRSRGKDIDAACGQLANKEGQSDKGTEVQSGICLLYTSRCV